MSELAEKLVDAETGEQEIPKGKKLSWKEKISYGFGDCGNGFMFDLGQAYLTKYWIDVCMIPAGAVAGIFAFTKIFDAFMDPLAGSLIDSRKNIGVRGKFRPVMMISSVLLALLTIVTFTMPEISMGWKIVFAYGAYMAWGLVYSFTNIPYGSLASVMTRDVNERSQLATTRQAGSVTAQLLTGIGFVPILMMFSNPHQGFFVASIIMAIIGVAGFYICYRNTREHVKINRNTTAEKKQALRIICVLSLRINRCSALF